MDILNKNSADQMILGNCDSCEGLVRIPVNANPNATVKCPRCGETFMLGALLDQLAPAVEFVDPPKKRSWFAGKEPAPEPVSIMDLNSTQPVTRKPGEKFAVSPILSKGAKRKKRRRRSSQRAQTPLSIPKTGKQGVSHNNGEVDIASDVEPSVMIAERITEACKESTAASATPETVRRRQTQLPRTKSSRSGLEMTKVILGAMLAIPVAQMLIWWFAGTDPLGVGPVVGKVAPFIVPTEFREETESDLDKIFDNDFSSDKGEASE